MIVLLGLETGNSLPIGKALTRMQIEAKMCGHTSMFFKERQILGLPLLSYMTKPVQKGVYSASYLQQPPMG